MSKRIKNYQDYLQIVKKVIELFPGADNLILQSMISSHFQDYLLCSKKSKKERKWTSHIPSSCEVLSNGGQYVRSDRDREHSP